MQSLTDAPPTGADHLALLLAAEQAAVAAGVDACLASCACHGNVVCQRIVHPHDDDQTHPHLAIAGGQLVQWAHTDAHGPQLTAEQAIQAELKARREHTRTLLASLDLDELRAALATP